MTSAQTGICCNHITGSYNGELTFVSIKLRDSILKVMKIVKESFNCVSVTWIRRYSCIVTVRVEGEVMSNGSWVTYYRKTEMDLKGNPAEAF